MKVVVTGATGFLGKKLAIRLNSMGFEVVGLGRNEKIGAELLQKGICFKRVDLTNKNEVVGATQLADFVFHCAALSSPWGSYNDFYQSNVIATENVVQACLENKVKRLIYVSTPSIYFEFNEREDVKENDPLPEKKMNYYAETKFLVEKIVDEAFANGLPVITIRPRALFGPEDTTILPRLIKTNDEKFIPLINKGRVLLDITYVENVVDALLLCMNSPVHTLGKKYNITNGEQVYLDDVLGQLFRKLNKQYNKKHVPFLFIFNVARLMEWFSKVFQGGKEPVLTKYTVCVLAKNQTLNIEAAVNDLGYKPKVSIDEGMDIFVEWWIKNENGRN